MLFDPGAHEPLLEAPWDPRRAEAAIEAVAADAVAARRGGDWWPWHPHDFQEGDPDVVHGVYLGAAGVLLGLRLLGHDDAPLAREVLDSYGRRPEFGGPLPSLWMGEGGIALVAGDRGRAAAAVAVPEDDTLELMWGSPGLLLLADALRLDGEWDALADHLLARGGDDVWKQRLYGKEDEYLGPAHGFAGAVMALAARRGEELLARAVRVLEANAARDGDLVNWPPLAGEDDTTRTQWCHGAPGIVASLAGLPADERLDSLLLAGGELTWVAGPLRKGAGLCHGTGGNGYAFLKLFTRTGDELWLDRARRFAMHAAAQVEAARREHSRGRYTLWTGDLGTAVYLQQCLAAESGMPGLDLW